MQLATRNSQLATRNSQLATRNSQLATRNSQLATKSGFTLVELSIVLVIIGLLIGGILVGQSLISSAKINKEVRRLSQYAIAIEQFKQKFRQEAGDSNLFSNPGNNNGDNNDSLLSSCSAPGDESYSSWSHLTQSGMISGETFTWPSLGAECDAWANINGEAYIGVTPTNILSANGSTANIRYNVSNTGYEYGGKSYKRQFYTRYNPEILWGLENKLDDGVPSLSETGRIASETGGSLYVCTVAEVESDAAEYKFCGVGIYFNESL